MFKICIEASLILYDATLNAANSWSTFGTIITKIVFVLQVEAFQVPFLRKQVQKYRSETEENLKTIRSLEETLLQEKRQYAHEIEEERAKYQINIARLIENHREQIDQRK